MNGLKPFERTIEQTTETMLPSPKTLTSAAMTTNRITSLRELLPSTDVLFIKTARRKKKRDAIRFVQRTDIVFLNFILSVLVLDFCSNIVSEWFMYRTAQREMKAHVMCTIILIVRDKRVNKNRNNLLLDCFSSINTYLITTLYWKLNNYISCFVTYEMIVHGDKHF